MKAQIILTILSTLLTSLVYSQATKQIPIYVTPIYESDPVSISTPDYQKELSSLTKNNMGELAKVFQSRVDSISIQSLFIFSIRLYDFGMKDESVYWFHMAKIRAGIFIKSLDQEKIGGIGSKPFELKQAFIAFSQLAGEYINGYAGGDVDKWRETMVRVKESVKDINGFPQYSDISFLSGGDFQKAKENRIADYEKLIDYLTENKEEIMKTRKENGIEGKY